MSLTGIRAAVRLHRSDVLALTAAGIVLSGLATALSVPYDELRSALPLFPQPISDAPAPGADIPAPYEARSINAALAGAR
jgi:hypothetical protein